MLATEAFLHLDGSPDDVVLSYTEAEARTASCDDKAKLALAFLRALEMAAEDPYIVEAAMKPAYERMN